MDAEYRTEKLTDELERKLIQHELDHGPARKTRRANTRALETVVGALLLLGMVLLAARFG